MLDTFQSRPTPPLPKDPNGLMVSWRLFRHRFKRTGLQAHYRERAKQVLGLANEPAGWSDAALQQHLRMAKAQAARRRLTPDDPAFLLTIAALCETAHRVLGQRPYAVQVMAALAMLDGYLVQLAPGEGKTLTLALVAVLRAWEPGPCHVITANDYLAERDATALSPLYQFCGLSAVAISQDLGPEQKAEAYRAPLVYTTAKQVIADHLIDRLRFGGTVNRIEASLASLRGQPPVALLQRGLGDAIVDEVDQILVDEAITPMIISEPEGNPLLAAAIERARDAVDALEPGVHYRLVPGEREVIWLAAGIERLDALAPTVPPMWRSGARLEDLFTQAVLAKACFIRDRHYVVLDDAVVIVDEATGRSMPGRSWSYGLHQAIEARAGVPLTEPSRTLSRLSFQNFFKLYARLTGASGTLQDVDHELCFNYRVLTLPVPPRTPSQCTIARLRMAPTRAEKIRRVIEAVRVRWDRQPVLIGTPDVASSEALAGALAAEGIPCQVLNAKQPAAEAAIVASAGHPGQVTVATNMAGRGTDIRLSPEAIQAGGLCVVMVEPHGSVRVDWQLFGRAGRQGEPGEVLPFASLEDDLLTRNLPRWLAAVLIGCPSCLVRLAQRVAQWRAFALRRRINRATRESREQMTFSNADA